MIADGETGPELELQLMHIGTNGEALGLIGRPNAEGMRVIYITFQGDILCLFEYTDDFVTNPRPGD